MPRVVVKCFPAPGFDGVFRAGRKWPADGLLVETSADTGDGMTEDGVLKLGTETMKLLEADGRFSFGLSETVEEIQALRDENAALKARIAELESADTKDTKPGKKTRGE